MRRSLSCRDNIFIWGYNLRYIVPTGRGWFLFYFSINMWSLRDQEKNRQICDGFYDSMLKTLPDSDLRLTNHTLTSRAALQKIHLTTPFWLFLGSCIQCPKSGQKRRFLRISSQRCRCRGFQRAKLMPFYKNTIGGAGCQVVKSSRDINSAQFFPGSDGSISRFARKLSVIWIIPEYPLHKGASQPEDFSHDSAENAT